MLTDWLKAVFTPDFVSLTDGILLPLFIILSLFGLGARYVYKKHINRLNGIDKKY